MYDLTQSVGYHVHRLATGMRRELEARLLPHGMPPHAYQVRLRCDMAKELLRTSSLTVLGVAHRVGYGSAQAFARSFRREVGCSPAQWRRQHAAARGGALPG